MFEWAPIFIFFWSLQLRYFLFTRPQMMHKWVHFSHVSKSKQHILVVYICCFNQEQALCGGSGSSGKKAGDCRRPVEPQTTLEVEFKLHRRLSNSCLPLSKSEELAHRLMRGRKRANNNLSTGVILPFFLLLHCMSCALCLGLETRLSRPCCALTFQPERPMWRQNLPVFHILSLTWGPKPSKFLKK